MSNTLNTPVEALEREFPLRVTRVRDPARLGRGRAHPGAATALVREVEALAEMEFSLLTERRRRSRRRAAPAAPRARPAGTCSRAGHGHATEELPGKATGRLRPGDGCGSRHPAAAAYGPPVIRMRNGIGVAG